MSAEGPPDKILARSICVGDFVHGAGDAKTKVISTRTEGRRVHLGLEGGGELVVYTADLVRVTLKEFAEAEARREAA